MSYRKLILLLMIAALLVAGCSQKNDDAAQLEKEYLGEDAPVEVADTTTPIEVTDSIAAQELVEEIPEVVQETIALPTQPDGNGYTVQVAGCEDESYASYLVEKYTKRGYEPFVTTATVDGQIYYRVRIGLFETLSEAKAMQTELNEKYSETTWIDISSSY